MKNSPTIDRNPILTTREKILEVRCLGRQPFEGVWQLQKELVYKRLNDQIPDTLIFVEHDPVYTLGKNADENHLLQSRRRDIPIFRIERGGDVTYHGPGQLVGYPILNLSDHRKSVSWYMRNLEEVLILTLKHFNIFANRREGFPGVWISDFKVAALGVRISRWITMHGFALNVNTDLNDYDGIIPCGIFEYGVTSMKQVLGYKQNIHRVERILLMEFQKVFDFHVSYKKEII